MTDISIIIPVYNVEGWLPRSVDAILANDTQLCELILVDDGSTDGSPALCDAYAARHPELIRVLHQKNAGPGAARNAGMAAAKGEWFLFVDSDDRLAPNALARLRQVMAREEADVISFQFYKESVEGKSWEAWSGPMQSESRFALARQPSFLLTQPSCWLRLWKRSVFADNGIEFPNVVWYEDVRTVTKLLAKARQIVNLPDHLYYYLDRPGSIMNSSQLARNRDILPAFTDVLDWFDREGLTGTYYDELCALTVQHVLLAASVRVCRIDPASEILEELRSFTEQRFPDWRENPYSASLPRLKRLALRLVEHRRWRLIRFLFNLKG
ncbi:MAG: glycosyltransferase family 2 protein [Oscillospiraceae bacterium]|nr:glycosyltransferase family 2 protein [Oscillospiraceae bacterium]